MNEETPKPIVQGPSLEQYIEIRFKLLNEDIRQRQIASESSLKAFEEANRLAAVAIKEAATIAQGAADTRYQQRFEAQSDALTAAFLSQQTAMQTAFTVAEKAVQAALAAAKEAVSKAELAADKRFEALNELRQMLNDMLTKLFTRIEAEQQFKAVTEKVEATNFRFTSLEGRFNTIMGELSGGRKNRDDSRESRNDDKSLWALVIAALALVASVVISFFKHP